jgi:hypothetical protein
MTVVSREQILLNRSTFRRLLAVLAVGVFSLTASAGLAGAESTQGSYTAQARQLGLTTAQAADLQQVADSAQATYGGRRIAIDRIRVNDGMDIVLKLPGAATKTAAEACPFKHMCAWGKPNFQGSYYLDMFHCQWNQIRFAGTGSWINNQYRGTVSIFRDDSGVARWQDNGAYDSDYEADWNWVHWVENC